MSAKNIGVAGRDLRVTQLDAMMIEEDKILHVRTAYGVHRIKRDGNALFIAGHDHDFWPISIIEKIVLGSRFSYLFNEQTLTTSPVRELWEEYR